MSSSRALSIPRETGHRNTCRNMFMHKFQEASQVFSKCNVTKIRSRTIKYSTYMELQMERNSNINHAIRGNNDHLDL